MKQDDRQLLFKDLCARLPYGVICTDLRHGDSKITEIDIEDGLVYCPDFDEYVKVENCHLYLRPMSSMTEEEEEYVLNTWGIEEFCNGIDLLWDNYLSFGDAYNFIDWLNRNYFDYQGLIEKGLALEAPENMYKTE